MNTGGTPWRLLWAGSEVRHVQTDQGTVRIAFSAACVLRGKDSGHLAPLTLVLDGAQLQGSQTSDCIGGLADGGLSHADGRPVDLSLPLDVASPVRLALAFRNGSALEATARGAFIGIQDGARFHEFLAC